MSTRIRGQEVTGQLVVDGKLLLGSFAKMESFSWKPNADLNASDFVGETTSEPDLQHHGYDFDFTIHELDNQAAQIYLKLVAALEAGAVLPAINFVVIKSYRDPSVPLTTLVFQDVKLKLNSQDIGGRKDYVKNAFSGKCRTMREL